MNHFIRKVFIVLSGISVQLTVKEEILKIFIFGFFIMPGYQINQNSENNDRINLREQIYFIKRNAPILHFNKTEN